MHKKLFFALLLIVLINFSAALYFHIAETERKCFIEEIPDETMVVAKYKCQIYDPQTGGFMPSSPGIGMHVEIRDPEDKIMMSKGWFFLSFSFNHLLISFFLLSFSAFQKCTVPKEVSLSHLTCRVNM